MLVAFEKLTGILKSATRTKSTFFASLVMLARLRFFEIAPEITLGMSSTIFEMYEFGNIIDIDEFVSSPDIIFEPLLFCDNIGTPFITDGEKISQLPGYEKLAPFETIVLFDVALLKKESADCPIRPATSGAFMFII